MTKYKKNAKMQIMTHKNICPFFGKCGGCLYQDLTESDYYTKKENFIKRAFGDYGIEINLSPIQTVPLGSRRRASFAYSGGRLGYNALKSHQIIEITECCLLKSEIVDFLPTLKNWVQQLGGRGDVFVLTTDFGLDIHIKPIKKEKISLQKLETLSIMANTPEVARLTYDNEPIASKVQLPFLPEDFLQPSAEGEKILIDLVLDSAKDAKKAVDLFCGGGTFTKPLLELGFKTIGYDCSKSVERLGPNGVQRDLFRSPLLPEELADLDLIVIDPPRAGAKAQTEQIAKTNVPKIIMVSCNPQTAARDIRILLDNGWELVKTTPVDQFTWSNHIELVCELLKRQ
jgi:23S rRNA (uracil1939-C5)-methyltransferase